MGSTRSAGVVGRVSAGSPVIRPGRAGVCARWRWDRRSPWLGAHRHPFRYRRNRRSSRPDRTRYAPVALGSSPPACQPAVGLVLVSSLLLPMVTVKSPEAQRSGTADQVRHRIHRAACRAALQPRFPGFTLPGMSIFAFTVLRFITVTHNITITTLQIRYALQEKSLWLEPE